jgi:hypothetical protein
MADERIVYGARCMWWDSISKVGQRMSGVPCCPHCTGPLFEVASEGEWWAKVDQYATAQEHCGYRKFIEWQRSKCFLTMPEAVAAYDRAVLAGEVTT